MSTPWRLLAKVAREAIFLSLRIDGDGGVVVLSDVDSGDGVPSREHGEVELMFWHLLSFADERDRCVRLLKTSFVMRGVREARSQPTHSCRADVGGTNARSTFFHAIQAFKEGGVASRAKPEIAKTPVAQRLLLTVFPCPPNHRKSSEK
jgi:hypothetical protein